MLRHRGPEQRAREVPTLPAGSNTVRVLTPCQPRWYTACTPVPTWRPATDSSRSGWVPTAFSQISEEVSRPTVEGSLWQRLLGAG